MVYLFSVQPEGFKELILHPGETYAEHNCLQWNSESKLGTWRSPKLVWLQDEFTEKSDADGDFLKFQGGTPVLSSRAYATLEPLLKDSVEFLPVWVDGEKRYLLNVLHVLDLMEKSRSTFKIYGDGQIGACEHAYINEPNSGEYIFKVNGYLPRVFINETIKNEIESAGLTGTLIREYKNPQ